MSKRFQPPTEFIAGLGIEFKKLPEPSGLGFYEKEIRDQLHQALGYVAHIPYPEPVHIPGTPLLSRHTLSLKRLEDEAEDVGYSIRATIGLPVEETEETVNFQGIFVVETVPEHTGEAITTQWSPLTFYDRTGNELEDPRDLNAAKAILKAAVKKPSRQMRKNFIGYMVNGRK